MEGYRIPIQADKFVKLVVSFLCFDHRYKQWFTCNVSCGHVGGGSSFVTQKRTKNQQSIDVGAIKSLHKQLYGILASLKLLEQFMGQKRHNMTL